LVILFVNSFNSEDVCDENVGLLVGYAFNDEIVANKLIGNIGSLRVRVSVGIVIGNCVGGIFGLLEGDVFGFSLGVSEEFIVGKFGGVCEGLFLGEFVGIRVGKLFGIVDQS
jgi:hypothetical protein